MSLSVTFSAFVSLSVSLHPIFSSITVAPSSSPLFLHVPLWKNLIPLILSISLFISNSIILCVFLSFLYSCLAFISFTLSLPFQSLHLSYVTDSNMESTHSCSFLSSESFQCSVRSLSKTHRPQRHSGSAEAISNNTEQNMKVFFLFSMFEPCDYHDHPSLISASKFTSTVVPCGEVPTKDLIYDQF